MGASNRRLAALLVLGALAGCAARSSQTEIAPGADPLAERTSARVLSVWREQLCRFIVREGNGDPAALAALDTLHAPTSLRPARITFGVLDALSDSAPGYWWDAQGLLVGRQEGRGYTRYVFVVAVVAHARYVATKLADIRLVALVFRDRALAWETGETDPAALERYRAVYAGAIAQRFPAEDDVFRLRAGKDRLTVEEARSAARWTLTPTATEYGSGTSLVLPVLRAPRPPDADRCEGA